MLREKKRKICNCKNKVMVGVKTMYDKVDVGGPDTGGKKISDIR